MKKNPIRSAIVFSVCLVHFLFLCLIMLKSSFTPAKNQHRPIRVKTVIAQTASLTEKKSSSAKKPTLIAQKIPLSAAAETKKTIEKKLAVKKETPPLKKTTVTTEKKSIDTVKPIAPPKPEIHSISPSLLEELEESIAKIQDKSDNPILDKQIKNKTPLSAPVSLQIDALYSEKLENCDTTSSDYISSLTQHLHASLHLPDFGEVKIELTLQQDGTVAKLKVLKAESDHNKKYLESHLPLLKFPHLTGSFARKNEYTFTVNFCNEL
jgi:outer membrane biosynthesis protein TonB